MRSTTALEAVNVSRKFISHRHWYIREKQQDVRTWKQNSFVFVHFFFCIYFVGLFLFLFFFTIVLFLRLSRLVAEFHRLNKCHHAVAFKLGRGPCERSDRPAWTREIVKKHRRSGRMSGDRGCRSFLANERTSISGCHGSIFEGRIHRREKEIIPAGLTILK